MKLIKLLPCAAIFGITACMASDGAETTTDPTPSALSFAELDAIKVDLEGQTIDANLTPAGNIPDGGTATYNGAMTLLLQDGSEDGVVGEAEVIADFATNDVSGGASNFYDLDGNATAGEVSIENTVIVDVLGNFIAGEVNGNVTFAAGAMDIDTTLAASFFGQNAEILGGVYQGTATPAGGDAILVEGGVFVEQ